ncbi:hypothetical protein EYF80_037975 [Liparis tanakae]|uniref:Uncharacterized protein n=1 Tax=Liparis tanakae TaxID=230148 RepID=A0A4Z2GE20_9TELE|nr:hypothetical protein EYF80_037975 [Liparis tanakae]
MRGGSERASVEDGMSSTEAAGTERPPGTTGIRRGPAPCRRGIFIPKNRDTEQHPGGNDQRTKEPKNQRTAKVKGV